MDEFIRKHGEVIEGVLSCFDRMLFRGYLPIMSGAAMAEFLQAKGVDRWGLKTFLLTQAARLKKHAMEMAAAAGRPYQYLGERTRKEDLARQIAERDGIGDGLVCVFALLELSRTFQWCGRSAAHSSSRPGESVCSSITTSWIASWGSSTSSCRPGSGSRCSSTSTVTSRWRASSTGAGLTTSRSITPSRA